MIDHRDDSRDPKCDPADVRTIEVGRDISPDDQSVAIQLEVDFFVPIVVELLAKLCESSGRRSDAFRRDVAGNFGAIDEFARDETGQGESCREQAGEHDVVEGGIAAAAYPSRNFFAREGVVA